MRILIPFIVFNDRPDKNSLAYLLNTLHTYYYHKNDCPLTVLTNNSEVIDMINICVRSMKWPCDIKYEPNFIQSHLLRIDTNDVSVHRENIANVKLTAMLYDMGEDKFVMDSDVMFTSYVDFNKLAIGGFRAFCPKYWYDKNHITMGHLVMWQYKARTRDEYLNGFNDLCDKNPHWNRDLNMMKHPLVNSGLMYISNEFRKNKLKTIIDRYDHSVNNDQDEFVIYDQIMCNEPEFSCDYTSMVNIPVAYFSDEPLDMFDLKDYGMFHFHLKPKPLDFNITDQLQYQYKCQYTVDKYNVYDDILANSLLKPNRKILSVLWHYYFSMINPKVNLIDMYNHYEGSYWNWVNAINQYRYTLTYWKNIENVL